MKGRAQRMRGFISKWRVAVGIAPFKKLVANKDANQDSLDNINCFSSPNSVSDYHFQKDPNEDFTIKAHRPGPTTSVPQTALATAPSFAVEIHKGEQQSKSVVKHFRWRSLKSKMRLNIKKVRRKSKTATDSSAAISASQPSDPHPPLTITVPETLQDQQLFLESPSDRVKRVASTAINNLGRAFSSCLPLSSFTPKTPPPPLDQNVQTSSSQQTPCTLKNPSNNKRTPLLLVKSCLASLKSKGKNWKDALKSNSKNNTQQKSHIFFSATFLDDMMDTMVDAINTATGKNTRYKAPKLLKKLWKRTSTLAAGF